jgi:hypothetical protein
MLVVVSLIRAVHGSPLKAVFRQLGPWVSSYEKLLSGWSADLWMVRMTSHSLPEWTQESDGAVSGTWPERPLWDRTPLRCELRGDTAAPSHRHKMVVKNAVQHHLIEQAASSRGPAAWLLLDPEPKFHKEGRNRGKPIKELPRMGWPTPWLKDVHIGVAACTPAIVWFALRLARAGLPDYTSILLQGKGNYWERADSIPFLALCPRCDCPDKADCPDHWLFECRGVKGEAAGYRERHRDIILAHIGIDVLDRNLRWWLLPLAAGHVHPVAWKHCSNLSGGKLQWADVRHKVLYLMVRVARMGLDMWRARCKDVYSFPPGSYQAKQKELVMGLPSTGPYVDSITVGRPVPQNGEDDGAIDQADSEARAEASAPLDQWVTPPESEMDELCSRCTKRMKRVFICHCEARHCCGTETECVAR